MNECNLITDDIYISHPGIEEIRIGKPLIEGIQEVYEDYKNNLKWNNGFLVLNFCYVWF